MPTPYEVGYWLIVNGETPHIVLADSRRQALRIADAGPVSRAHNRYPSQRAALLAARALGLTRGPLYHVESPYE